MKWWCCLLAALGAVIVPCMAAEQAAFAQLNGAQIRSTLQGKVVGDDRHWAHHYLPDGRVTRLESGRQKAGQWSVQHDQLCLLKPEISKTESICYDVYGRAGELQYRSDKQVVYQGLVRGRAGARMFEGVTER